MYRKRARNCCFGRVESTIRRCTVNTCPAAKTWLIAPRATDGARSGCGVKQMTKMIRATSASQSRWRSSGMSSSTVRGCRGPMTSVIATSRKVQTSQLVEKNVRQIATPMDPRVTAVDRRPSTAYEIWPPSSWPIGKRFNAVASSPNHAANAIGCRFSEYPSWNRTPQKPRHRLKKKRFAKLESRQIDWHPGRPATWRRQSTARAAQRQTRRAVPQRRCRRTCAWSGLVRGS